MHINLTDGSPTKILKVIGTKSPQAWSPTRNIPFDSKLDSLSDDSNWSKSFRSSPLATNDWSTNPVTGRNEFCLEGPQKFPTAFSSWILHNRVLESCNSSCITRAFLKLPEWPQISFLHFCSDNGEELLRGLELKDSSDNCNKSPLCLILLWLFECFIPGEGKVPFWPDSSNWFISADKSWHCLQNVSFKPQSLMLPLWPCKTHVQLEIESTLVWQLTKLSLDLFVPFKNWILSVFLDFFTSPVHAFRSFSFLLFAFSVLPWDESTPITLSPYCNAKFWLR